MTELEIHSALAPPKANALDGNIQQQSKCETGFSQIPEDVLIGIPECANEGSKNAFTYASFGDNGTTVSINSYGIIIQITQYLGDGYLGDGKSGFFAIDDGVEEPCFVKERAQSLMNKCDVVEGIGWVCDSDECDDEILKAYEPVKPWKLQFVQDRWPRLTSVGAGDLTIISDNFISNGIVFQHQTRSTIEKSIPIISKESPWLLPLNSHWIRELDFTSLPSYSNLGGAAYESYLTSDGFNVVWVLKEFECGVEGKLGGKQTVCFIAAIRVNGTNRKMKKVEVVSWGGPDVYQIELEDNETISATPEQPLKIMQAFRLKLVPKSEDWSKSEIGISKVEFRNLEEILNPTFKKLKFITENDHLDFMVRRNLEHILSVCSIPVPELSKDGITPIALTCGDVSGHRISTSASL